MVYKLTKVYTNDTWKPSSYKPKYKHMTLDISILKNAFPLHTNMQNYHRKHPNVLR